MTWMSTPLSSRRPGAGRGLHRRPPAHLRPGRTRRYALAIALVVIIATAGLTTAALAAPTSGARPATTPPAKQMSSPAFSYDLVTALGAVYNFGGAGFYGDERTQHLVAPIVAMAVTPDGRGYWLVGADGSVFNFGDAHAYGSLATRALGPGQPVVTMVATADGKGYWLVNESGAITPFGDAVAINAGHPLPPKELTTPVVSAAIAPNGTAAWFTDSVGHVYGAGTATWYGARVAKQAYPISAIALAPSGGGYWLADSKGDVWGFGATAPGVPAPPGLPGTLVGMIPAQTRHGYWAATSDGSVVNGGDAGSRASTGSPTGISDVVGIAAARRVELSKLPTGAVGYDINWPQCAGSASSKAGPLPGPPGDAAGSRAFSIAVVGVDGWAVDSYNPCLTAEAAWAKNTVYPAGSGGVGSPPYDLYMFLNSPSSSSTIDQSGPAGTCHKLTGKDSQACLSYNYGYNSALDAVSYATSEGAQAKTWWLDIENDSCAPGMWNDSGAGEWWSCDLALNARTIQGAIDALRSLHLTAGIYCTHVQWAGITNSYLPTGGAPLIWVAGAIWTSPPYPQGYGYTSPAANTIFCTESQYWFAGGKPVMLQETPGGGNNYPYDPDVSC